MREPPFRYEYSNSGLLLSTYRKRFRLPRVQSCEQFTYNGSAIKMLRMQKERLP